MVNFYSRASDSQKTITPVTANTVNNELQWICFIFQLTEKKSKHLEEPNSNRQASLVNHHFIQTVVTDMNQIFQRNIWIVKALSLL